MIGVVLAGGSPKLLRLVLGDATSRSLLKFPKGTLLETHVKSMLKHFDRVIVVSDDPRVGSVCSTLPGCMFVEQRSPGIEGAICDSFSAISASGEKIVTILYGDIYAPSNMIDSHMNIVARYYEPVMTVTRPVMLRGSFLQVDIDPIEMSIIGMGRGQLVFAGLMTVNVNELRSLICQQDMSLHDALTHIAKRQRIHANMWLGEWVDLDTPWDYLLAVRLALSSLKGVYVSDHATIKDTAIIEPPVFIDDDAFIDHYAVLKGPVFIARGARIGAHSFLRNNVAVYEGALVGAYSEVKRSIIYDRARIGSHSYIADSVVGKEAHVAPYTVTENVPYTGVAGEIVVTSTHPLEGLKVGAIIAANSRTTPHSVLKPASIHR
ncbi:glucose-1-phosphate thymidylyltransferase [Pyrodictium delaneyi]|nr:NDP-sugar synthase [Pyrodictium delaneyi]ALL01738.1 glucose-1-phosphate thymidylyltransferase [Pyrodictium delaneyi]